MKEYLFNLFAQSPLKPGINELPQVGAGQGRFDAILAVIFGLAGAVALLFLVISGFRFIISRGDPNGAAQARNGIIYSIIGLLVVIFAFTIVTFVLNNV